MSFLLGSLLLLCLCAFFAVSLRRYAEETDAVLLALASLGLAGCGLVLGGALLIPWMPPTQAMFALGFVSLIGTFLIARGNHWKPLQKRNDSLWLTLVGIPGMLICGVFALFIMSVSIGVEDGFFLHITNMGMMLAGKYPPLNLLGDQLLGGHYGKDLLTALLALCFGVHFLDMEWISTFAIQVLHFAFVLHWFRVEGGSPWHGLLGAYFLFFGSAFGSHMGLADTVANNNAVAYIALTLCSYLLLRWWRIGRPGLAVLAGVVLGLDALIYELHFGLMGLTLFVFTVAHPKRYRGFFLLVTVAVLLASVEGGAITHLARKLVLGNPPTERRESLEKINLEVKFPKELPFTLRTDNLRPSRFFETKLRPVSASFTHSRDVVPAWSPRILASLWYPAWLAPLTLLALIRQRNVLAGWFFSLGTFSFLTPCLVSFGYFDGETARWLFSASIGFSTAFALTLAQALSKPTRWRPFIFVVALWAVAFHAPVLVMECREVAQALREPGQPLVNGSPGIPPSGSLIPNPSLNLSHHFSFRPESWEALEKLRDHSTLDADRFLSNYPDERPVQGLELTPGVVLNQIGLQAALSARLPAGVSGAPETRWCAPLFSQKLEARAFWADPEPWRLAHLGVTWLIVDETRPFPEVLRSLPWLSEVYHGDGVSLWKVGLSETDSQTPSSVSLKNLTAVTEGLPTLHPRKPFVLPCVAEASLAGTSEIEVRYFALDSGEPANPRDRLLDRPKFLAGKGTVPVDLIGPSFPGRYRLEWKEGNSQAWKPLGVLSFEEPPKAKPETER